MQKIWMLFENQSLFVYVIAGVCLWGVLSKLILQGRLHRLLKASETMASTTQRQLRTMRNHYENNLNNLRLLFSISKLLKSYKTI